MRERSNHPHHAASRGVGSSGTERRFHHQRISAAGAQRVSVAVVVGVRSGCHGVAPADTGEPARWAGIDSPTPHPASADGCVAGSGPLGAGLAELQSRGPPGQCPADCSIGQGLGDPSPHRLSGSVAPASRRWHRQDAGTAADDADLPRLRPRRRHQLRGIRQCQPPGHLATSRSRSRPERRRCCSRSPAVRGRRETNADRPIH